jgi:3-deoxy-D-manno-octulosonate 8-phosphate phosphatase (KDO 8-P phosphatase)
VKWSVLFLAVFLIPVLFSYETKEGKGVLEIARNIKLIAFDVAGVMTNGDITYTSSGDEIKTFNVKDGLGLVLAGQNGFITAIITGRESPMVERRGKGLKVHHVYQNAKDKTKALEELAALYNLKLEEICYMGDDLPDLGALKIVGLSCCPSDAVPSVKEESLWISSYKGGRGAVRELTDFLISAINK